MFCLRDRPDGEAFRAFSELQHTVCLHTTTIIIYTVCEVKLTSIGFYKVKALDDALSSLTAHKIQVFININILVFMKIFILFILTT